MANPKSLGQKKNRIWNAEYVMMRKNRYHGLLPMREALERVGHPENELKIIHVAGTNGKGSTTNYLKDILMASGFRVGTFTSPHLMSHYDRIRIDDKWISEDDFNRLLESVIDLVEEYDLGMFEIDLLLGLMYFREAKVDYVILETGVGGRLDNTNVIDHPILEIITSIDLDHTAILGNRLSQIAYEKAGIIKKNTTVLVRKEIPSMALDVIKQVARRKGTNCISLSLVKKGKNSFFFKGEEYSIQGARYQRRNALLALGAAWCLGIDIHAQKIKEVIKNSKWAGRFEIVHKDPLCIIDGAHNIEGMKACVESVKDLPRPIHGLYSALKDKHSYTMVKLFQEVCDDLTITEFEADRAATIQELEIEGADKEKSWKKAINVLFQKEGTIVITGSLYFISEVRKYIMEM